MLNHKIIPLKKAIPIPKLKKENASKRIAISLKNEIRIIEIKSIIYLKSDSNYTEIHLEDGSKLMTSSTLKKYEAKLNHHQFIRVHNSYLLQKNQLASFLPNDNLILLHNSQEIPVSRSKKEDLIKYLKTLMV